LPWAQPIEEAQAPGLYAMVRRLATQARIPMPRVYLIPTDTPNAFATGRNPQNAAIAVTEGIMRILDEEELEGVLAHELAHVANRDVLISTVAATLAGPSPTQPLNPTWRSGARCSAGTAATTRRAGRTPFAAIFMAILAPIAAMLVQMAVSRSREYQADASGDRYAGETWGLAKALEKLHMAQQVAPMAANPPTAPLFIVNPLTGRAFMNAFSTHPPMEERIARLRAMPI
jgi:heat shock protein HtpX